MSRKEYTQGLSMDNDDMIMSKNNALYDDNISDTIGTSINNKHDSI